LIRFGEGREQGREGGLVDLYFRVLGFCQVSIWGRKQGTYFTFTFVFSSSCVDGWVDVFFFFLPLVPLVCVEVCGVQAFGT
jgi:hypothetical protein